MEWYVDDAGTLVILKDGCKHQTFSVVQVAIPRRTPGIDGLTVSFDYGKIVMQAAKARFDIEDSIKRLQAKWKTAEDTCTKEGYKSTIFYMYHFLC